MYKYVVRLDPEAREQLLALVNTGRAAAVKLLHARILLNADVDAGGRRWTDAEMAEALDTSAATTIACARPGSHRAWRRQWPANAPPAGSIANWMESRRRS